MSTRTKVLIAVGGVVAVAIVAIVVVAALGGSSKLHLPATLGGQPRLTSEVAKGLAEGMKNEIKKQGGEAPIIALYGPPTSAKYILMEFSRSVKKDYPSLQEAMKSVGTGVARTAGSLDLASAVYDTRSGTDYGCAPVDTSGSPLGSMCIWDDGSTSGFTVLVSVTELQNALDITAEAHDASVS